MNLLPLLVQKGLLKAEEVAGIEEEAKKDQISVTDVLEKHGTTTDAALTIASEHYGIPYRRLPQGKDIEQAALEFIPQESAEHYRFIPLGIVDGALEVGITDPDNIEARDALQFISTRARHFPICRLFRSTPTPQFERCIFCRALNSPDKIIWGD